MSPEWFRFDNLALVVSGFALLFYLLIAVYSLAFLRGCRAAIRYHLYLVLTLLVSLAAFFANNVLLFLVLWGFLGMLLYLLIGFGTEARTSYTAKKALIIIGGTDVLMILGFALCWQLHGSPDASGFRLDLGNLALDSGAAVAAFLCLVAGAMAKAGLMPFHTWVPDCAEDAPIPVTAFLPASLDKLLGIYFLVRIILDLFRMNAAMNTVLMFLGAFTIIAAVMMALVQHDLRRLLGYHAVSQVGYMVLGLGTGNPVGIVGGVFHMVNHAIYKSCLFMSGGEVVRRAGHGNLDEMGGYARSMPLTFVSFLIASLAISGIPPLNGFASKWMIYQGVIESGGGAPGPWLLFLVAALFGTALTLASFMKLLHAVFLGQPAEPARSDRGESSPLMWGPSLVLAFLCLLFGVFALAVPVNLLIAPGLGMEVLPPGVWDSPMATALILCGVLIGLLFYAVGLRGRIRVVEPFVGGEVLDQQEDMRISGVDFYLGIRGMPFLSTIYGWAEAGRFDVYELGKKASFGLSSALGRLHNGVLPRYVTWCLVGIVILLVALIRWQP